MRILIVTNRVLKPVYGEDKILTSLIRFLSKRHTVYLKIISAGLVLKIEDSKIERYAEQPKHIDLTIIHHDVSLLGYFLTNLFRGIRQKNSATAALIFFIDTYSPVTFIRCLIGWAFAQMFTWFLVFSHHVHKMLCKFGIIRSRYTPFLRVLKPCICNGKVSKRGHDATHICYIGVVDNERFNVKHVARLAYRVYRLLGKNIKLTIVTRPDHKLREGCFKIRPWLEACTVKRVLSVHEKCQLLSECHIAVFTAKRVRFVFPPVFLLEASWHKCIIYAPNLANLLRSEGLSNVYDNIDDVIVRLKALYMND